MFGVADDPAAWGVRPVLGHLGTWPVPAYAVLVGLALAAGFALLWWDTRRDPGRGGLGPLALAALVGGAVGAKLLEWAFQADAFSAAGWRTALASGRTIVGGFLGGTLAVAIAKRRLRIAGRRGNALAAPIALGLGIGRVGCFLAGCCYGVPTRLPWGVDFGDGVARHPTQLYEAAFALSAFAVLRAVRRRITTPGRLFGGLMIAYFAMRFAEEFVREEPRLLLGMTLYQLASAAGLAYFLVREARSGAAAALPETGRDLA